MTPQEIQAAFQSLEGLHPRGIHYDLDVVAEALEKRGHPERKFKSIIVAGTNGKGSTSAMLAQMLRRLGFRTGLYTSPHLLDVRERIQCGGLISLEALAGWIRRYESEGLLETLTYYEALTCIAFDWFAEQNVEWAILEVGVGGRLDVVNLAPAEGAVIVSIDFDHRELLGDTIPKIAAEKAGVIKEGRPVVIGELPAEALQVIEAVARERCARLYGAGTAFTVESSGAGYVYKGASLLVVPKLALEGMFQGLNMGCAIAALERIVGVDPGSCASALREALSSAEWPARFQKLSDSPLVILDGAHNPAGARALAASYRQSVGERQATLIFAALADKDHNAMLAVLRPLAKEIWLSEVPDQIRAIPSNELRADPALSGSQLRLVPPQEIIARIRSAPRDAVFLITGSLMFAGWFLGEFQGGASKP